ncbi:MAG: TadE family protein [Acidimicrobiia bacterium]
MQVGRRQRRLQREERGATLVEFALILPLLLALVFGIIEASWAFGQHNDVRHGAREGARLAAVDFGDGDAIANEVCQRMDSVNPALSPEIELTLLPGDTFIGGRGEITVTADLDTVTGVMDAFFGGVTLKSTVEFRLEQPLSGSPTWSNGTYPC